MTSRIALIVISSTILGAIALTMTSCQLNEIKQPTERNLIMNKKATLVVTASPNPEEMEAVQSYLKDVMPLFVGAGGKLVKRLKVSNALNGSKSGMVMVMDFDSEESIKNLFSSKEYMALIPIRDKGFSETNILIAEEL